MIVPLISGISVSVYWMLFSCILLVRLFLAKTTSHAREARHTIPKIWKQHSMNSHGNPWYQYIAFIVPQSMFTLPRLSKTLQYLHDWCACGPFWPFPAAPPWKGGRRHQGVSPFYRNMRWSIDSWKPWHCSLFFWGYYIWTQIEQSMWWPGAWTESHLWFAAFLRGHPLVSYEHMVALEEIQKLYKCTKSVHHIWWG